MKAGVDFECNTSVHKEMYDFKQNNKKTTVAFASNTEMFN